MRIVIIDDHPLYLEAVRQQVSRIFEGAEVSSATTLDAGITILEGAPVDLVMVDYSLPGVDGLTAVTQVLAKAGKAAVIVMSGIAREKEVFSCIQVGVRGFFPKTLECNVFASAISLVANGGTYVPIDYMMGTSSSKGADTGARDVNDFTDKELALLRMVVDAASNKEIARAFNLQEVTVKFHLTRIFRKMGVKNRSQAAVMAVRSGLIPDA